MSSPFQTTFDAFASPFATSSPAMIRPSFLPPTPDPSPELLAKSSPSSSSGSLVGAGPADPEAEDDHEPSAFTLDPPSPPFLPSTSSPSAFGASAFGPREKPPTRPAFSQTWSYSHSLSPKHQLERRRWLSAGRGRSGLRIVIVTGKSLSLAPIRTSPSSPTSTLLLSLHTSVPPVPAQSEPPRQYPADQAENFLPKVDGVTRTLSRLLEHLRAEGHEAILLGPETGRGRYAGHPLVGTAGVPLVVYPGLKLNFLRPRFLSVIRDFQPDIIHFVDPIWLGAQVLMAMELGWAGEQWVSADGPALGAGIKGAVVASYHTNLATYATLFGMNWLEPIIWKFQRWLYSKTSLSLCPSPSTSSMLSSRSFPSPHLWPRGVDLELYGPHRRSAALRAEWGCAALSPSSSTSASSSSCLPEDLLDPLVSLLATEKAHQVSPFPLPGSPDFGFGINHAGRKVSMPLTPPETPETSSSTACRVVIGGGGVGGSPSSAAAQGGRGWSEEPEELSLGEAAIRLQPHASVEEAERITVEQTAGAQAVPQAEERAVLIYVGRISWEKNLLLFLSSYPHLLKELSSTSTQAPKVVFVGDGPARPSLTTKCAELGIDATFCGHQSGEALAERYASGDVFVFPSFTETFGQVILEALASGLPVVGLDAEGTRDLVKHGETGLLLSTTTALHPPADANSGTAWAQLMADPAAPAFQELAGRYAGLIAELVRDERRRRAMGQRAREGVERGWGWWEAMEKCVDGYRLSLAQSLDSDPAGTDLSAFSPTSSLSPTFSHQAHSPVPRSPTSYSPGAVNRVVSRRLAHRDVKRRRLNVGAAAGGGPGASATVGGGKVGISFALKREEGKGVEFEIGLKTLLKLVLAGFVLVLVYWHHRARVVDRALERMLDLL